MSRRIRTPIPPPTSPLPPAPPAPNAIYNVSFSGKTLSSDWLASDWAAPLGGTFDPSYVTLANGCLVLKMTQQIKGASVVNIGSEVQLLNGPFGYGTYTWVARMGSTAITPDGSGKSLSGGVSGLFTFFNDSESEIDFEVLGDKPDTLFLTNWNLPQADGQRNQSSNTTVVSVSAAFHEFKMVWAPNKVDFYVDGVLRRTHTQNVPTAPAFPMINHWGGVAEWGGLPTTGTRYLYVKSFSYGV